jgi:hypothetical protein
MEPLVDDPDDLPPPPEAADPSQVELVLFPGEVHDQGVWRGMIYGYVDGDLVKRYEACAGPAPGDAHPDAGGHEAGPTDAGSYTLGGRAHHTSPNWPRSVIPWGAALRQRPVDQEIEFCTDGQTWRKATGLDGLMTLAELRFEDKTRAAEAAAAGKPPEPFSNSDKLQINAGCRRFFFDDTGALRATYEQNDFGPWAWNLITLAGDGTEFYVHTTPGNEAQAAAGQPVALTQSHGCIHIRPADRDEMEALGLLQRGVRFTVKPYGVQGP